MFTLTLFQTVTILKKYLSWLSLFSTNYKNDEVCKTKHHENEVNSNTSPPDFIFKGYKTNAFT